MRNASLLFLLKGDQILLAMKKRGLGEGKWNGPGGKQEPGESVLQAAVRETEEEIGVTPLNPRLVGKLKFYLVDQPEYNFLCHMFVATDWQGEPHESDEMRPQWFSIKDIPYDQMWADDFIWMPILLDGGLFEGSATLDGNVIITEDIKRVEKLSEHI